MNFKRQFHYKKNERFSTLFVCKFNIKCSICKQIEKAKNLINGDLKPQKSLKLRILYLPFTPDQSSEGLFRLLIIQLSISSSFLLIIRLDILYTSPDNSSSKLATLIKSNIIVLSR